MSSLEFDRDQKLKESFDSAIDTLKLYRDHGIEPGSGTRALLENDLFGALRRSDPYRQKILGDIARWMDRNLPGDSYGSREKVNNWIAARRKEQQEGGAE